MCIAAWSWMSHPRYSLILLFNRDEFHNRPAKPASWWVWQDSCQVLGGRDCLAGGTWMACTKDGRLAFLTNVLEPKPDYSSIATSRGDLPLRFLKSEKNPLDFADEIVEEGHLFKGFNLILADLCSETMVYVSNRPKGEPVTVEKVLPGLHVLTNAKLDSPWHKALRLGRNFKNMLSKYGGEDVQEKEMVEYLMGDRVKADRCMVPHTGLDPEWEWELSSIFVESETEQGLCGTRSTSALTVESTGHLNLYEKYMEKAGSWKDHSISYQIEGLK